VGKGITAFSSGIFLRAKVTERPRPPPSRRDARWPPYSSYTSRSSRTSETETKREDISPQLASIILARFALHPAHARPALLPLIRAELANHQSPSAGERRPRPRGAPPAGEKEEEVGAFFLQPPFRPLVQRSVLLLF